MAKKAGREFIGPDISTQRVRVTTERLSDLCNEFVHVFLKHGDNSITDQLFTYEEGRFLLGVLQRIYKKR